MEKHIKDGSLLTAEKVLRNQFCKGEFDEIMECLNGSIEPSLVKAMVEFAKLHVEAALREASEKAQCEEGAIVDLGFEIISASVDKNSILNSYPLSNIK